MELKQLQSFIAIAEEGSITAAARRLHIAQPPLSQQLKQLERELGVRLVQRGARRCTLTEAGEHLFGRAQQLLSLAAETKQAMGEMAGEDRMPLRIGMISSSGGLLFAKGFRRFVQEHPNTPFQVVDSNTYGILNMLESDQLDLGIIRTPFLDDGYRKIALAQEPMAVATRSPFEAWPPRCLADLRDQPLILYRRFETILIQACRQQGFEPRIRCLNDDARTTLLWADAGLGVALVPQSALGLIDGRLLLTAALEEPGLVTQICIVWRDRKKLPRIAQALVTALTRAG